MKTRFCFQLAALVSSVAVMLALATGCVTPVKTEFKSDTPFAAWQTFALLPFTANTARDPGATLRFAEPARVATADALTAKGFRLAELKQADFAVNVRGEAIPRVEVKDWGYTRYARTARYGRIPVHVGDVDVRSYDEKTLTIEIFDNKSHELVWTGWMTKDSVEKTSAEQLQQAIVAILAKFPPTPAAK